MGVEHGKPQQFFSPDKGGGRSGKRKREEARQLKQVFEEFRNPKHIIPVFSTESKVDPSSPLQRLISDELQEEEKPEQKKSKKKRKNFGG